MSSGFVGATVLLLMQEMLYTSPDFLEEDDHDHPLGRAMTTRFTMLASVTAA